MIVEVVEPNEKIFDILCSLLELFMIEIVEWVIWLLEYHISAL